MACFRVPGVSGNDIDAIPRLDRFIETLRDLRADLAIERPLAAWSVWLLDLIDALFAIDIRDDAEDNAMSSLRRCIPVASRSGRNAWRRETAVERRLRCGAQHTRYDFRASAVPARRRPVLWIGAATFDSVSRRLPARHEQGASAHRRRRRTQSYARRIRVTQRPRHARNRDRYLFLEALMAARQHVHLSYLGEDVADGSRRNPRRRCRNCLEFLDEQFDAPSRKQPPAFGRG